MQTFKLDKANVEDIIALTPMQAAMLFQHLKEQTSDVYFERLILELSGTLSSELLRETWQILTQRNEALRSVFRWEGIKEPVRIVLKSHTASFRYMAMPELSKKSLTEIRELLATQSIAHLDLREVPFRLELYQAEATQYFLVITYHHILFDGWSTACLLQEMTEVYAQLAQRQEPHAEAKPRFSRYVKWLQNKNRNEEAAFWKNHLANFETHTELPFDIRATHAAAHIQKYFIRLSQDESELIKGFIKTIPSTLAAFIYAAWGILLQKYTDSLDVVFGTTVSGRNVPLAGIENMVGLFINTVPLRLQGNSLTKVRDFVKATQCSLIERERFETSSINEIKSWAGLSQHAQLFDTYIVIENYPLASLLLQADQPFKIMGYAIDERTDLDLEICAWTKDSIEFEFTYNDQRYPSDMLRRLAEHFKNILCFMAANGEASLKDIHFLSDAEKKQILVEFNDTATAFASDQLVYQQIQQQMARWPNKIAVMSQPASLTYQQLDTKSSILASHLRKNGIKPGSIVSILIKSRLELVVAILAILKAGGAYTAIDPDYPEKRIDYILKDTGASILLSVKDTLPQLPFAGLRFDLDEPSLYIKETSPLEPINVPTDPAYVVYTSGTTGNPKGVVVEHGNLSAYLHAFQNEFHITEHDTALQQNSPAFDAFVEEIFPVLLQGGTIFIGEKAAVRDVSWLAQAIPGYNITLISSSPLMLNELDNLKADVFKNVKLIISGGDVLKREYVENLVKVVKVCNIYGPAEATVGASYYTLSSANWANYSFVPIGKPIANYTFYILDHDRNLLPIDVPGEIYIGGLGITRGYLNQPQLTQERFICNPFGPGRLYRTGDRGKWLRDGNIEFLDRLDNQVSLMGHRIELGEIEAVLIQHENVEAAAVISKEKEDRKFLSAYLVASQPLTLSELRQFLLQRLPMHMIPAEYTLVDQIPLTLNGKADQRALEKYQGKLLDYQTVYQEPKSELQYNIANIWREVLDLSKVGIDDNLFEVGGNSLSVIRLKSRLSTLLQQDIPITAFFEYPTIRSFSRYMARESEEEMDEEMEQHRQKIARKKETLSERRKQKLMRSGLDE